MLPYDDRDGFIWMDGEMRPWREAKMHTLTHGMHYGGCVFEGLRAYDGKIFKLREHTERLIQSAKLICIKTPFSVEQIEQATIDTVKANDLTDCYIRPFVWRGSKIMGLAADQSDVHVAIAAWYWPSYLKPKEGDEVSERIDLAELVERVADNARRAGVTIEHKNQGDLFVFLKPVAFERCLGNVVSNAGKYGHHVWLTASRQDDRIRVVVDDDGPGIPAEKREEVFRPFFRLDESRNPDMGGVGLGLPIAQDIVHAHGGEIELSDSPHGGLRVTIDVPV